MRVWNWFALRAQRPQKDCIGGEAAFPNISVSKGSIDRFMACGLANPSADSALSARTPSIPPYLAKSPLPGERMLHDRIEIGILRYPWQGRLDPRIV